MKTIIDFLVFNSQVRPNQIAFTFIEDNGETSEISFEKLHQAVQSIAGYLTANVKRGESVVLLFPQGLEYIQAFLGCLYAGIVAVPLYPPQSTNHSGRVSAVIEDCNAVLALASDELQKSLITLPVIGFSELLKSSPASLSSGVTAGQLAFLQYTSGSTGSPKGVMVSHENIVANLKSLQGATLCSANDVFCNWLPLFHDLGLVNTILLPIYLGCRSVLMSPARFIKRPVVWFQAISKYSGSICGAPNFAFDHCISHIQDDQLEGVDLSSWRVAFNAAEPVSFNTIQKFSLLLVS